MFGDIGWAELMIIGVVALIVIGPKDLPEMFRQLGRITAKLRGMARDFSRAMEDAAKESGMADAARDLKAATSPTATGMSKVKEAADKFDKWDPLKTAKPVGNPTLGPLTPPPMPATVAAKPAPVPEANSEVVSDPAPAPAPTPKAKTPRAKASTASIKATTEAAKPAALKPDAEPAAAPKVVKPKAAPRKKADPS
jgi:sec-independent protein translocase protein TatB